MWHITADAFHAARATSPALDAAVNRYLAQLLRAALAPSASALGRRPSGREGRPIVRVFDSQPYQYTYFEEINNDPHFQYRLEPIEARLNENTVNLAAGAMVRAQSGRATARPTLTDPWVVARVPLPPPDDNDDARRLSVCL